MNKVRRKMIDKVIEEVAVLQNTLEELQQRIEEIKEEEQDYLDNIPENLQAPIVMKRRKMRLML